jgi:hypothetical protein
MRITGGSPRGGKRGSGGSFVVVVISMSSVFSYGSRATGKPYRTITRNFWCASWDKFSVRRYLRTGGMSRIGTCLPNANTEIVITQNIIKLSITRMTSSSSEKPTPRHGTQGGAHSGFTSAMSLDEDSVSVEGVSDLSSDRNKNNVSSNGHADFGSSAQDIQPSFQRYPTSSEDPEA